MEGDDNITHHHHDDIGIGDYEVEDLVDVFHSDETVENSNNDEVERRFSIAEQFEALHGIDDVDEVLPKVGAHGSSSRSEYGEGGVAVARIGGSGGEGVEVNEVGLSVGTFEGLGETRIGEASGMVGEFGGGNEVGGEDVSVERGCDVRRFDVGERRGEVGGEKSEERGLEVNADKNEELKDSGGRLLVQQLGVVVQTRDSRVEEPLDITEFEVSHMVHVDEMATDKMDEFKGTDGALNFEQPLGLSQIGNSRVEEPLDVKEFEVSDMVHADETNIVKDEGTKQNDFEGVFIAQKFEVIPQPGDSSLDVEQFQYSPITNTGETDAVPSNVDMSKEIEGVGNFQQLPVLPQIEDTQVKELSSVQGLAHSPLVETAVEDNEKEMLIRDEKKVEVIGVSEVESTVSVDVVSSMVIEENVLEKSTGHASETQVEEVQIKKPANVQEDGVSPMVEDEDANDHLVVQKVEGLPKTDDQDGHSNKADGESKIIETWTTQQSEALPEVLKESIIIDAVSVAVEVEKLENEPSDVESIQAPKTKDFQVEDEEVFPMDEEADVLQLDVDMDSEAPEAMETEAGETSRSGNGKRKRGRPAKAQAKTPPLKKDKEKEEEDVCFICFDGGDLVLCDRRGCPKAYHPACVSRDEAFFRSKGRWNCGWHLCSICEKAAHYMCYTCTYSLCKGCVKEAEFFCVRGNKGFCETCMTTVKLIEKNKEDKENQVNFNDKNSWEYLFKEYWVDLKRKLSLSVDELSQARNPCKGSVAKKESSDEAYAGNDDQDSDSDSFTENIEVIPTVKKRKGRKPSKLSKGKSMPRVVKVGGGEGTSALGDSDWASKDLLEFVSHMKNGDTSIISQFDVQALLLEYIKQNNLRDPKKKSQIVCDSRLENLFGKARVGHFEMLKLLESHFFIKEDNVVDDTRGEIVDTESSQLEAYGNDSFKKKRKSRKKGDDRASQTNLDEYAAINVHNIHLLYLRRNLMEDLLGESEKFHNRVVGSFVRIRISGAGQKHDMYRLVQVIGTRKVADQYKTGKRSTDIVLEIINLSKTESISIDTVSNQDFSEDECKRLRQSIKCGLINRMTVGELQEKAIVLQEVRVNDWLETEKLRLSNLRDRASDRGHRKELRECIEKLQLLKTPEERLRRLREIPKVQSDPHMDPNYESEEDEQEDPKQGNYMRSRESGLLRKAREPISPGSGGWKSSAGFSNTNAGTRDKSYESSQINGNDMWEKLSQPLGSSPEKSHWSGNTAVKVASSPRFAPESTGLTPVSPTAANFSETDKIWNYMDPANKMQGPFSMVQLRKWSTTGYFPTDLKIWKATDTKNDSILLTDAMKGNFYKEQSPLPQHKSFDSNGYSSPTPNSRGQDSNSRLTPYAQVHNSPHPSPAFLGQGTSRNSSQNHGNSNRLGSLNQSRNSPQVYNSTPHSVEIPKFQGDGWAANHNGKNNLSNLPSPTPVFSTPIASHQANSRWATPTPVTKSKVDRIDFSSPPSPTPGAGVWNVQSAENNFVDDKTSLLASPTPAQPALDQGSLQGLSTSQNQGSSNSWESNTRPPEPLPLTWDAGAQENPNIGNLNVGWGGLSQGNTNMAWQPPPQGHAVIVQGTTPQGLPVSTPVNWVAGPPPQGNTNPGWGQSQPQVNTNAAWGSPAQQMQGNTNAGRGPTQPQGQANWGNRQNNGGRFSGGGDHGRDFGRGGGGRAPWDRQSSFGSSGSSRPRVCNFFAENGHCKRGTQCKFLHQ